MTNSAMICGVRSTHERYLLIALSCSQVMLLCLKHTGHCTYESLYGTLQCASLFVSSAFCYVLPVLSTTGQSSTLCGFGKLVHRSQQFLLRAESLLQPHTAAVHRTIMIIIISPNRTMISSDAAAMGFECQLNFPDVFGFCCLFLIYFALVTRLFSERRLSPDAWPLCEIYKPTTFYTLTPKSVMKNIK